MGRRWLTRKGNYILKSNLPIGVQNMTLKSIDSCLLAIIAMPSENFTLLITLAFLGVWFKFSDTFTQNLCIKVKKKDLGFSTKKPTYKLQERTQSMGKERENSYRKMKRSPEKTHTNTSKLIQNISTITDVFLNQKSKCTWTHDKDGITWEFLKGATRVAREEGGRGKEGTEGKLNRNYLRLIPGMCLEDRMNW